MDSIINKTLNESVENKDYLESNVATDEGTMSHKEAFRKGLINETDLWLAQNVYRGNYYVD